MSRLTAFRTGFVVALACARAALGGVYDGAAGTDGSLAVAHDDPALVAFATGYVDLVHGPAQLGDPAKGVVSFGSGEQALGAAGLDPYDVVSLGDGGAITLTFAQPISDGPGWDFAVFENSFSDSFLELAAVEVSSNGTDFFRFDAVSKHARRAPGRRLRHARSDQSAQPRRQIPPGFRHALRPRRAGGAQPVA